MSHSLQARKIRQEKRHNHTVIALARRRCDVLFAMLRDRTIYQSESAPDA
ncbi:transposase [Burkholderia territorii]|uniref:Transposase n=1 Tax=Burkholderia territorii TaxID=1503055 RepID=A0A108F2S1_9BURK|nr:transposase [Burkholderia territorii]